MRCSLEQMLEEGFYHAGGWVGGWVGGWSCGGRLVGDYAGAAESANPPCFNKHTLVPAPHPHAAPAALQTRTRATCCAPLTASLPTWILG